MLSEIISPCLKSEDFSVTLTKQPISYVTLEAKIYSKFIQVKKIVVQFIYIMVLFLRKNANTLWILVIETKLIWE